MLTAYIIKMQTYIDHEARGQGINWPPLSPVWGQSMLFDPTFYA